MSIVTTRLHGLAGGLLAALVGAGLHAGEAPGGCGEPTAGDCLIDNGSPFCDDPICCNTVCSVQPFCCDVTWDINCAALAEKLCDGGGSFVCGEIGAGDCFQPNGSPACQDFQCCDTVCQLDPFCCDVMWDDVCADLAQTLCQGGDADGDGVPNELDVCPTVFNPNQDPIACSNNVQLMQVDWLNPEGLPVAPNSDYGQFMLQMPNLGDEQLVLFVNAFMDGQPIIRNMPIYQTQFPIDAPFETYTSYFPIGPNGVDVSGEQRDVHLWVTPMRLDPPDPFLGALSQPIISQVTSQEGDTGSVNPDAAPPPADGQGDFPAPKQPAPVETSTRPGLNMVDLDSDADAKACAPGAVASSFAWLSRTYSLGLPEGATPEDTKNTLLDDFKDLMDFDEDEGTEIDSIDDAKTGYIRQKKLPLTVEGQGAGSPNEDDAIDPAEIWEQMQRGQDVEVTYTFGGENADEKAHTMLVDSMTKEGDSYTMTGRDDGDQDGDGGERTRSKPIKTEDGDVLWGDGRKIVGWVAESPTAAAMNRALRVQSQGIRDFIAGLGGSATEEEARELLRRACRIKYIADRLKKVVDCTDTSTQAQKDQAQENVTRAGNLKTACQEFLDGFGLASSLPAIDMAAQDLIDATDDLVALYPPDADFDDIPDASDNAPASANPAQDDCNNDGIGDVDQLVGNDCNNNAWPDDCDIANGVEFDLNGDGIPDSCQSECFGDLTAPFGQIDADDLLALINQWGPVGPGNPADLAPPALVVDADDLLALINAWGLCPKP